MDFQEPTKSHDNFLGRPSLVRVEKIDVSSDIQILHNALKFITSKRKIVDVLCSRTNRQRIEIIKAYKACYDRDLVEEFQRKFSGDFRDLLIAMLTPTYEFYCRELFDALNGTTVNEDTVIQILVSLSSREIYNVIQKYVKLYGNPLEKDLKTETSGNFKKLLVALANGTRDESNVLDLYSARVDAMELKRAGTEKWGTDASVFNRILCLRNFDQVRLISQEYEFVTGHPLDKDIKKEFSGDILDGILAIIRISENRAEYFARCLYKSMIGIGTDDRGLIRLIITRCELDMEDIKGEFQRKYGKTLKSMIKKDTSGYYRKALLKLIAE